MTATSVDVARGALGADKRRQLADDVARLRSAYGPRWTLVPRGFADRARSARATLSSGLAAIDPTLSDPVRLPQELAPFATETATLAQHLHEAASYLSDGLSADVSSFPLRRLRLLAGAISQLADAPPPHPSWADPRAAEIATVVLEALGGDLREAARLHDELYREFTEDLWQLESARWLSRVDERWRVPSRRRARTQLAAVSRRGQAPADVPAAAAMLRRAVTLRANITRAWTTLSGHLGWFAWPMPDVDGATASLGALRDVQAVLFEQLDVNRLRELATADAFASDELRLPAKEIEMAIDVWAARARRFGAFDAVSLNAGELAQWANSTLESLAVVREVKDATAHLRSRARTVGDLLEDVIARERIDVLCGVVQAGVMPEELT